MATKRAAAAKATSKMTNGASTKVTKDKPAKAAASKPAVTTTKKTMAKSRTIEVDEASPTARKDSAKAVAPKKSEKKKAAPPAKTASKGKPVAKVTRARKSATPAPGMYLESFHFLFLHEDTN